MLRLKKRQCEAPQALWQLDVPHDLSELFDKSETPQALWQLQPAHALIEIIAKSQGPYSLC